MNLASHFVSSKSKKKEGLRFLSHFYEESWNCSNDDRNAGSQNNLHSHQVTVQWLLRQPVRVLLALVGSPVDCCSTAEKVPQLLCDGPGYKQYKPNLTSELSSGNVSTPLSKNDTQYFCDTILPISLYDSTMYGNIDNIIVCFFLSSSHCMEQEELDGFMFPQV